MTNDVFDELQNADLIDNCLNIESSVGKQSATNNFSNNFSKPKTRKGKNERRGKRQNKSNLKNSKEKEHKNHEDCNQIKNHDINGGGDGMYTADNICRMIEFLIDNIFVRFGGRLFHQMIGIPMETNWTPLLADLFLYSYENEFLDNMIRSGHRRLARSFNLCYKYIDDLIVFNTRSFFIHPS